MNWCDAETGRNILEVSATVRIPPVLWFTFSLVVRADRGSSPHPRLFPACSVSCVVQSLPVEVAEEVCDSIHEIPSEDPYNIFKDAMIKRTGLSNRQRSEKFFTNFGIGGWEPSQLFRYIKRLQRSHMIDNSILNNSWVKKFPYSIRKVLALFKVDAPTAELTETADRMLDANPKINSCGLHLVTQGTNQSLNISDGCCTQRRKPETFIVMPPTI